MKLSPFIIITILGCQGLSGCQTFNTKNKDTCGRKKLTKFVGTPFDDLIIKGDRQENLGHLDDGSGAWKFGNRTYFLRVLDQRGEEKVVLANYSSQRLNIRVGIDGNIEKLSCG